MTYRQTRRGFVKGTAGIPLVAGRGLTGRQDPASGGGPPVYLDYSQEALDRAYDQGVWADNIERIQARRQARIGAALSRLGNPERRAYGPTPAEHLDLFRTGRPGAPIHIFIHGGAWRGGGGPGQAADAAEVFVRSGAHFLAPDHVLVQDSGGSLFPMVDQLRRAVLWVHRNARTFGGDPDRIFLSGFSAGGHLAGVVLTTDWQGDHDAPPDLLKGGLCISGMFDLLPVSLSSRREYVFFDETMVQALSPVRHLEKIAAPIILGHGTAESPEFQHQTREFADALRRSGKPMELLVGEGCNHFEMRETLANPFGLMGRAALSQMGLDRA